MGGFTISPSVFQCMSSRSKSRKRDSLSACSSQSTTSDYKPVSAGSSVGSASSTSSLASTTSSSSRQNLLEHQQSRPRKKTVKSKGYNATAFTGPTAFSVRNGGYSPSELASLQAFRFAGR